METENATRNWDSAGSLGGWADLVGGGVGVSRLAAHAGGELVMRGANRLTFVSHFVICLACAAMAFFAWQAGAVEAVWRSDASMMTSVIACLFMGAAVWLGRQAWLTDGDNWVHRQDAYGDYMSRAGNADFGHSAERWSVMLGLLGTTLGLSLQAKSLAGGSTSFGALATSLYTTGTGIVAALLIGVMVFSLEAGIRRAAK